MIKILFICHGNICRSPMAEFVLKDMAEKAGLADQLVIDSAATSTEEIGNGIHHGTMSIFRKYHIPCTGHRARQMTRRDYEEYDYLIGMDHWNIRNMSRIAGGDPQDKIRMLLDFTDRAGQEIADPWYTGEFETTYRDVLEGCQGFLAYIREEL